MATYSRLMALATCVAACLFTGDQCQKPYARLSMGLPLRFYLGMKFNFCSFVLS